MKGGNLKLFTKIVIKGNDIARKMRYKKRDA